MTMRTVCGITRSDKISSELFKAARFVRVGNGAFLRRKREAAGIYHLRGTPEIIRSNHIHALSMD